MLSITNKGKVQSLVKSSESVVDPITTAIQSLEKKEVEIATQESRLMEEIAVRNGLLQDLSNQHKINIKRLGKLRAILED